MTTEDATAIITNVVDLLEAVEQCYRELTHQQRLSLIYAKVILQNDVIPKVPKDG